MGSEVIKKFIVEHEDILQNSILTCADLIMLKDKFYCNYMKKPRITEALILRWLHHRLGMNPNVYINEVTNNGIILRSEKKYEAGIGRQTLDISILSNLELIMGISIKVSTSTSAYLDGADFFNPILERYSSYYVKSMEDYQYRRIHKKRIGVPTLLQDMARIENIQQAQKKRFNSLTIVFAKKKQKDEFWITEFEKDFNHKYLFLADTPDLPLREAFEVSFPSQIKKRVFSEFI
ncbi:hypothetical protein [Paenibacillus sp. NRS-1760]|uniref:hypothetical protein n=1 Tax=Paenibacillus sp. NRS-1760 TaxID=3233902 RepID=UPI003D2D5D5B